MANLLTGRVDALSEKIAACTEREEQGVPTVGITLLTYPPWKVTREYDSPHQTCNALCAVEIRISTSSSVQLEPSMYRNALESNLGGLVFLKTQHTLYFSSRCCVGPSEITYYMMVVLAREADFVLDMVAARYAKYFARVSERTDSCNRRERVPPVP
ncbi:hypothetical protein K474DRAFT_287393 [Panus rudis PR-1116 ss-1]|nr:hypothetical protein K474DRAFT_287393 [Panus rudis PR-1116 ss-1]